MRIKGAAKIALGVIGVVVSAEAVVIGGSLVAFHTVAAADTDIQPELGFADEFDDVVFAPTESEAA